MKKLYEIPKYLFNSYLLRVNPIIKNIIINKYKSPLIYQNYSKNQFGGSNNIHIIYNNEKFIFEEYEPNYWTLRSIDEYDCITIGIEPEKKEAFINNINSESIICGSTIFTNQGSHLLNIGLLFLRENKKQFNINKIILTDNALKTCPNNKRIQLGVFLTLLTGDTWYTKYGFRPIDKTQKENYRYNREIMNTKKLGDINFNIILNKLLLYKNKKDITEEQYNYFIKVYEKIKDKNILVKDLLKIIFRKEKYNLMCNVFNVIVDDFAFILKLKLLNTHIQYELKI